jgi:hypothetical protein
MRKTILALMLAGGAFPALAQTPPPLPRGGPMRGGAMIMRADANRDGIITRAEAMAQADAAFDRVDGDRDGAITPGERREDRRAMRAILRDRAHVDANAPPAARERRRGMTREAMRAHVAVMFDRADANRDGRVDQAEINRLGDMRRHRRGDMPPPPPARD